MNLNFEKKIEKKLRKSIFISYFVGFFKKLNILDICTRYHKVVTFNLNIKKAHHNLS